MAVLRSAQPIQQIHGMSRRSRGFRSAVRPPDYTYLAANRAGSLLRAHRLRRPRTNWDRAMGGYNPLR